MHWYIWDAAGNTILRHGMFYCVWAIIKNKPLTYFVNIQAG